MVISLEYVPIITDIIFAGLAEVMSTIPMFRDYATKHSKYILQIS
jgi:hypothetical protein